MASRAKWQLSGSSSKAGRAGRLFGNLGLLLLGSAIGLALLEGGARLLPRPEANGEAAGLHQVRVDRPWLYGLKPGLRVQLRGSGSIEYRINAAGFRDREASVAKRPGVFRAVAIGDSLTFGYGVAFDDTWPRQLESRLAESGTVTPVEILNLGVSGYNAYTEAALFGDLGVSYAPDLVLVQFCINDLNDPTMHFETSTIEQLPFLPDEAFPDPSTRRSPVLPAPLAHLCWRSRACTLIRERLAPKLLDEWIAHRPVGPKAIESGLAPHARPGALELEWLARQYGRIAQDAARIGARFAVVIFPFREQEHGKDPEPLQESLLELGVRMGWPVIDLLPAFRAAARRDVAPLFSDLWHPTVAGQRAAADALATELVCRGLVPQAPGISCEGVGR